ERRTAASQHIHGIRTFPLSGLPKRGTRTYRGHGKGRVFAAVIASVGPFLVQAVSNATHHESVVKNAVAVAKAQYARLRAVSR
ncbi:MAG TPA: hypothetical protein VGJ28_18510, partial [Micromonosporaceae bacterium]